MMSATACFYHYPFSYKGLNSLPVTHMDIFTSEHVIFIYIFFIKLNTKREILKDVNDPFYPVLGN